MTSSSPCPFAADAKRILVIKHGAFGDVHFKYVSTEELAVFENYVAYLKKVDKESNYTTQVQNFLILAA